MAGQITFGRWLKRLRAEQDLTQEMLAELANCAANTLRSFEIGRRRPSREMAERLALVLKVPADQQSEFLRLARLPVEKQSGVETDEGGESPHPTPLLPRVVTPLIGREVERAVLTQLIRAEGHRLVTLLGAGGMGKTRLALAVASEVAVHFTDKIGFVALASLEQAQHLPAAIAHALNIPLLGVRDPAEQLLTVLATRQMLLVLDNFEHLLIYPEAAQWITTLLTRAPAVQLLITSRERLRIAGERVFALGGLTVANSVTATKPVARTTADALLLFLERAQAAASDFVLNQTNQTAISRICALVGGMPLAIELAAAWVRVLSPAEIAAEIERSVDFLAHADRDGDSRHQSMRAVFDHSWSLLGEDERRVLAQLAVFRGGCRREAAAAVAGATLPILAALIDKSLLRKSEVQGSTRYELHELIRQYVAERLRLNLADAAQTAQRHGEYYCTWVAEQSVAIGDQRQAATINELRGEIDNLRLAWDWAVQARRGDLLYPIGRAMWIFFELQNYYQEGEERFGRAAQMAQSLAKHTEVERKANDLLLGRMTTHQAYFVARQVRLRAALTLLAPALALLRQYDDHHTLSQALWTHGRASWMHGDFAEALANFREGLILATQLQFPNLLALYHTFLGAVLYDVGEYTTSYEHLQQALRFARQLAEPRSTALSISYLHYTALALARSEEVRALLSEGLHMARAANDWYCVALALEQQALAQWAQDDVASANQLFVESHALFQKIGDLAGQSRLHAHLGQLALQTTNLAEAQQQLGQAFQIAYRVELLPYAVNAVAGLALLAAQQEEHKRALTLACCVLRHPASSYATQMRMEKLRSELAEELSPAEQADVQTHVDATLWGRVVSEFVGQ